MFSVNALPFLGTQRGAPLKTRGPRIGDGSRAIPIERLNSFLPIAEVSGPTHWLYEWQLRRMSFACNWLQSKLEGVSGDSWQPLREEIQFPFVAAIGEGECAEHLFSLNYLSVYAFITHTL
ncbi:hypothetical protein CDAR_501491 [Caerostris darwini]|uniref:Uncharacterized protein n=1 Tax=Caerostris darwini TaxID=1538125 RepID=A0AAV4PVD0_9ARAC|nr:hypothetical protein CDAR_501491 [Caerostris darwini]